MAHFKLRYTDFLVNEILPNGEVVHLTTLKWTPHSKVSSDEATVMIDAAQSSSKPAETQDASKTKVLGSNILQGDVVLSDGVLEEPNVRSTKEDSKSTSTEDETKPKTLEGGPKVNSVDEEVEHEESLIKQPITSVNVDMIEQAQDATAGAEPSTESTAATKPDPVSSVDKWQKFASLSNDFKVKRVLKP